MRDRGSRRREPFLVGSVRSRDSASPFSDIRSRLPEAKSCQRRICELAVGLNCAFLHDAARNGVPRERRKNRAQRWQREPTSGHGLEVLTAAEPIADPPPAGRVSLKTLWQGAAVGIFNWECEGDAGLSPERALPWHAIAFARSGSHEFRDARGTFPIDPTQATLFNPDSPYRTRHPIPSEGRRRGWVVSISESLAAEMIRVHDPRAGASSSPRFRVVRAPISGSMHLGFLRLIQALETPDSVDRLEWEADFVGLLDRVVADAHRARPLPPRGPGSRRREAIEFVKEHLSRHFARPVPLVELAHRAGLSPYYLCRSFKAETGTSIHAYRVRLRLRAALDRLADRKGNLAGLALDLGFNDHSHFTAAFRKEFGVPPSHALRLYERAAD